MEDTQDLSKMKEILLHKIGHLTNSFIFSQDYSGDIIAIFGKLTELLYNKIHNTLNQHKTLLKFFKDVTGAYNNFSSDLSKATTVFKSGNATQDQMILPDNLNYLIEQTQISISKNFINFSSTLQSTIISKGPFHRIKDIYSRLHSMYKDISKKISALESYKHEINKIFNSKYSKTFESFKKEFNNHNNNDITNSIFGSHDFLLAEMELTTVYNKLYTKTRDFLVECKAIMSNMRGVIHEYIQLMKESIDIYIHENKKIFNESMSDNFENIQKYYDALSKDSLDIACSVAKVMSSPEMMKTFNELFKHYQITLIRHNIVQDEKIYNDEIFKAEAYTLMDEFLDFFISINPPQGPLEYFSLILCELEIKRDPGIFKSWKTCKVIVSKQNNVMIFDENIAYEKFVASLNMKKLTVKKKHDKKNPFRFEIIEARKGIFFNSSVTVLLDAECQEKFEKVMEMLGSNVEVTTEDSSKTRRATLDAAKQEVNNKEAEKDLNKSI